jgi:superfamily II DNA or RNA helicase
VETLTARELLKNKVIDVFNKYNKVLVKAGTGVGKSKIGLELAIDTQEPWVILVPSTILHQTWKDEAAKWGYSEDRWNPEIYCYASAHKLDPVSVKGTNVILDEAHRVTERNWPFIKAFLGTHGKLICLSATVPYKKKDLLAELGIFKEHTVNYSLDSAVEDNLVSDYKIEVVQFPLANTTKEVEAGKKGAKFMVTEQQGYTFVDQRARQAMYFNNPNAIKFAMLNRMRYIYNLPSKLRLAQLLLSKLPKDKKVLIFCGSIMHANAVCPHRYHSKTTLDDYEAFCEGKIHQLAVVQSVAEGVNIPNIDYAILMQVQSEDLHTIQKIGRALRKTDDPDKCSRIVIFEAQSTQDSKWVANAIQSFDPAKVDYISLSQILNKGLTV